MYLLQVGALLVFAAAVGGYAYLFRKHQLHRLQRLREADARLEAKAPRHYHPPARVVDRPRRALSSSAHPGLLSTGIYFIIAQLIWVLLFTVLIGIGIIIPGAGALKLFHHAGLLTQYPLTPASLFETVRYAVWAAAGLVMLGMLGFRRYGLFLAVFLAGLFGCSLIAAILFSSLVTMPVHLVVSPLFGIDAWNEWRPFVHLAFVVLGVPWAFSICYEARRDLLGDHIDTGYGGSYRFSGSPGTAGAAGGALFGGLFHDSGGAGGSWSNDSGGDSD